jgi:hypothetical protein
MKTKTFLLGLLIAGSALFFGVSNTVNAETTVVSSNSHQLNVPVRVELQWINGTLWIIVYDADDNIIQASAVGHGD